MDELLSRILYLAQKHRPRLPSPRLLKLLPHGELIEALASGGAIHASRDLSVSIDQIQNLVDEGSGDEDGDTDEFRLLLSRVLLTELEARNEELKASEYLKLAKEIAEFAADERLNLFETQEVDLLADQPEIPEEIPKYNTGFTPLDLLLGGLYQSITTVIARPGDGKTSLMVSLMEAIVYSNAADSVWLYEIEIPKAMMEYRIVPVKSRIQFRPTDRLVCGYASIDTIEQQILEQPNEDRVILIDSPDVMAGGTGEGKRFALEEIYMGLIRLKMHSKSVIVTSWPRRKDSGLITLDSVAESWSKSLYSDIVVGLKKISRAEKGYSRVRLNCPKNRFGIADRDLEFLYHYGDLTWSLPQSSVEEFQSDW